VEKWDHQKNRQAVENLPAVENPNAVRNRILWKTPTTRGAVMPPGSKPQPVGKSNQRETVFKWNIAEHEGWQHGKVPPCPKGLSAHGQKAWRTWMNAWWACFYTPDDLPGLELLALLYDKVLLDLIDVSKITPLLDRYGITPKARQDLRWARSPEKAAEEQLSPSIQDEIAERRQSRRSKLA
jgi:hypothetical protein